MERLENELKQIYRRRSPAPGFTERVMNQVRAERAQQRSSVPLRWIAVGALAASVTAGIYFGQQRKQVRLHQQAEVAEAQLIESLQIAGLKIGKARQAVLRPDRKEVQE